MKAGHAHVIDGLGFVQLGEDGAYLIEQIGTNPAPIILFKEPLQALVSKPDYHTAL